MTEPPRRRVVVRPRSLLRSDLAAGVVLTAAAAVALLWANSRWKASYFRIWEHPVSTGGHRAFADLTTVQAWVNGGLMAVFFLVVGLEIGRERRHGELADSRTAAVPVVGAAGGMLGAALVYAVVVHGGTGSAGWGIPMATDIAFALAALALLGRRVPPGLRLLLLALAVADDIGSVVVLAVFYSARTWWPALVGAAVLTVALVALRRRWRGPVWVWLAGGAGLWVLLAAGGVEPALAGVVAGLLVPGRAAAAGPVPDPARRTEDALAPVASFVVLPLFALANAGITLSSSLLHPPGAASVFWGVVAARVVGKLAGITLACAAVVRFGPGRLPAGVRWGHLAGGAAVAGIGFTVPLLIAERAFPGDRALVVAAEAGLLAGSVAAFALGATILVVVARRGRRHMLAPTVPPGDRSTGPGEGHHEDQEASPMPIAVGDRIPDVPVMTWGTDGPTKVQTGEVLGHGKVVLFAVPGAFTPTCSDYHLPSYLIRNDELRAKGVDAIVGLSVNDPFVMGAWGEAQHVGDQVTLLADGNGEFTRAVGLEMDGSAFGLGTRSQRYAAVIEDGVVTVLNVEPGPGLSVSAADAILEEL